MTIELDAEELSEGTYSVTATVGVEPGGVAKTVSVHIVDTLFGYPGDFPDGRYNNCVRQGFDLGEYELAEDQTTDIRQDITFRSESWADRENIRIIAFVQDPADNPPAEVYQSEIMFWPFESECVDDVNDDGAVNIDDVFNVPGAWGACDECPQDVNSDGKVDIDDLFQVLGAWGPC